MSVVLRDRWAAVRVLRCWLFAGGGFELDDGFGGYAAAVFDVDALGPGPVPHFGIVGAAGPGLGPDLAEAGTADVLAWPPRAGPGVAARGGGVAAQGGAQRLGVLGAEVDLVLGPVQPEPDRALGLAAV